ncbi:MAG TPA: hypothetical protein VHS99_17425 [Chloroflexota bacterium]|jgi:hypothetical protein|nr:hypothetical protein [Chloroflexota bacterium]
MNELIILIPLVLVASLLSISLDWRVALASLWAVHLLVSMWLAVVVTPEVALAKAITGSTVCLLLWPSLRALFVGSGVGRRQTRRVMALSGSGSTDEPFMLFGALLAAAAAIALAQAFPLVDGANNFAWLWLALLGLLLVVLSRDIVRVGLGLLLLVNAVDLVDTMVARNQGLFAIATRSTVAIVLALSLALCWTYLQARGGRFLTHQ